MFKGQEQAAITGLRLNELATKINFTKMHKSTMIRAVQTADIIKTQLTKDIPVSIDPLLCEGAPIPPEPPVGHWKPELYVKNLKFSFIATPYYTKLLLYFNVYL